MEIRQLKYMLTVAEERSFSKAAARLYIAQPHLSQYIQKLEKQIGVKLFDRSCTPLKLTYAGEKFAIQARQILQMDQNLLQQMKDFTEEKGGSLSLGITPVRGAYLLPKLLPILKRQMPQVNLTLYEGTSAELEDWLNRGVTDLTILSLPIKSSNFSYEVLLKENFLIMAPPMHPLSQSEGDNLYPAPLKLTTLQKEPFILLRKEQALRRIADSLFLQSGFRPNILLETKSYKTAQELASLGMGFTFSAMSIYQTYRSKEVPVRLFTAEPRFTRTLAIVYRKGKYLAKFERDFITMTKEIVQSRSAAIQ